MSHEEDWTCLLYGRAGWFFEIICFSDDKGKGDLPIIVDVSLGHRVQAKFNKLLY